MPQMRSRSSVPGMRVLTAIAIASLLLSCSSSAENNETSGGSSGVAGTTAGGSTGGGTTGATSGGSSTGGGTTGGDTWTSWASPDFFQAYCTSCHSAGGQGDPSGSGYDWTQYADVQTDANLIRCGVAVTQDPAWHCPSAIAAKQFPIGNGPHPSDADRDRLVGWIDAGLPEQKRPPIEIAEPARWA